MGITRPPIQCLLGAVPPLPCTHSWCVLH